jgi:hypothetical protein
MLLRLGTWNVNGLGKWSTEVEQIRHETKTTITFLKETFQGRSKEGRRKQLQVGGHTQYIPGMQREAGERTLGLLLCREQAK